MSGEALGERKSLMFASDDLPDMLFNINLNTSDIMKYGVDGEMLLPMSDYVNETLTPNIVAALEGKDEAVEAATAPDGKMYTIPGFDPSYPGYGNTIGGQRCFIDTKYMEKAGIEKSPETLDEFIDMLRAFKQIDPAEMGVDEIYPFVATVGRERECIRNAFGWIGGDAVTPCWDAQEKDVTVACNDAKYADFLKVMNAMYTEGLIHPDFLTMDVMTARALYSEGKVPVVADAAPYVSRPDHFENYIALTPLGSEWCEEGVVGQSKEYNIYGWHDVYISADTEYPELCMRLLDYLYSSEGTTYATDGCPVGSEDAMGMIEGFDFDENGNIQYMDVENGKAESYVTYSDGVVSMGITGRMPRILAQQGHMVTTFPNAYMDDETNARYSDLFTVIFNYVNEESAKFIVGQRPLEETDLFFEELKALGIEEYEEIVREFYANFVADHQ